MIKVKKVKVDMNPKRVQNPYEQYKRSPGKFDQKVRVTALRSQNLCKAG